MGGWHRRFRKNHFLAWKFYTKTVVAGCDTRFAMICTQVLAHSFSAWAALPHMSAQEKREVEYKNEVEQLRQQAAAAAGEKLAQAAEQLKVSHKQLYEAEKDKQALREQVIRSLLIYSRSLLTYTRSLLTC
jgi:hypothetical protein